MTIMTKPGAIIKIKMLRSSDAKNYFETKERLFLQNMLTDLEKEKTNEFTLNDNQVEMIQKIFEKYKKFL